MNESVFGKPTIRNTQDEILTTSFYGNRYLFTGREFEPETGLFYYRARYYHPTIGRFMQTDPIGYNAGLNLYTYCKNNPVLLTDPFGTLSAREYFCTGVGGAVGASVGTACLAALSSKGCPLSYSVPTCGALGAIAGKAAYDACMHADIDHIGPMPPFPVPGYPLPPYDGRPI